MAFSDISPDLALLWEQHESKKGAYKLPCPVPLGSGASFYIGPYFMLEVHMCSQQSDSIGCLITVRQ